MNFDTRNHVEVAYKKLKQMVYYEKHPLNLRRRLAEFECAEDFSERLRRLQILLRRDNPHKSAEFISWLKQIDFTLAPKGVKPQKKHSPDLGSFVSNVTSSKNHAISKVNYLFDGPVELHLIGVLWLMIEGHEYDKMLSEQCSGSRLHNMVESTDDHSAFLFKKYHELYTKWRDTGIEVARNLLTKPKQGVCLVGLDIQEYYYRIEIDWEKLRDQIPRPTAFHPLEEAFLEREALGAKLFKCLEAICTRYRNKVSSSLDLTHRGLPSSATCLPIGLCTSPVIANWYLKVLDDEILEKVRPAYYGRYVDDIFMVVPMATPPSPTDPINDFMDRILVKSGIVERHRDQQRFELTSRRGLFLQEEKCTLQFFDSEHSIAGLEKFQRQIQENASLFALLPVDDDESPIAQVAYDLLYDGSVNKFRSVKAVAENRWALAQHLAKQTQLLIMTDGEIDATTKKQLFQFFKGRNAINFWDMWERVFAFFIVGKDLVAAKRFFSEMIKEVEKIRWVDLIIEGPDVSEMLQKSLREHANLGLDLSKAILDLRTTGQDTNIWRDSNLIRHHLVAIPLLNYTSYKGNLAFPSDASDCEIDPLKTSRTPRYVYFDECMGYVDSGCCIRRRTDSITKANKIYEMLHGNTYEEIQFELVHPETP